MLVLVLFFFFQAEDGIRDTSVTGVQTCALPISSRLEHRGPALRRIGYGQRGQPYPRCSSRDGRCGGEQTGFCRSEERRVGKEWSIRWGGAHGRTKEERERWAGQAETKTR